MYDVSASIIRRPLGCPLHHQDLYSAELRAVECRVQAVPQEETSWAADPVIAGQPLATSCGTPQGNGGTGELVLPHGATTCS
jgi:hypothetical protein